MLSDDTSQYQGPIEPGRPASSPRGGVGADVLWALALAAVIAVLGLGLGLLWHAVAPTLPLRIVEQGAVYTSPEPVIGDTRQTFVTIVFTASTGDARAQVPRTVDIRLVPPDVNGLDR